MYYYPCVFFVPPKLKIGGHIVLSLQSFCHSVLSKTLTLLMTLEQWVLELWYFTWAFLVIRPFQGYHYLWHWSLTHFLKTLTLLITFEQWVLELWYFTWVLLVARPFIVHQHFWTCNLDLGVWPIFENFLTLLITWTVRARSLIYFTWVFQVTGPFLGNQHFLPCDLDGGFCPPFEYCNLDNNIWIVSVYSLC